jgi:long-chain acyl-CoA synthetase
VSALPLGYRTLLHDTLRRSAAVAPDRLAVAAEDGSCTFGELDLWSDGVCATLREHGIQRGDRVAVFMDNTVAAAVSLYGILKAGGAFVMVNPLTKADKLSFIANDCGIRGLVTDAHLGGVAGEAVARTPSLTHLILTGEFRELPRS